MIKQRIEYFSPGEKGEGIMWDLSDISILDDSYPVKYESQGDTIFNIIEHKTKYEYRIKGDTLFWNGFENNMVRLFDSIPAVAMVYPMAFGQKALCEFYQKGTYSQTLNLSTLGSSMVEADSHGRLITQYGDTLNNVLRVHRNNTSFARIDKLKNVLPIDTLQDTLITHIEDVYSWYAEGYRYPIIETVIHIYKDNEKVLNKFSISFLCSLEEQLTNKEDDQNNRKRVEKTRANRSTGGRGEFNHADINNNSDADKSNLANGDPIITQTDENITVSFISNNSSQIEVILTDLQGRVFASVPKRRIAKNEHVEYNINKSGLIPAEYLLHINLNTNIITKKFIIR